MLIDFSNKLLYNEVYLPILNDQKRYIFLMGSAGSGKSVFQAQKEVIKSFSSNNRLLGVRKVYATIRDSVFSEIKNIIEQRDLVDKFEITTSPLYIKNKLTGSDMIFRGMDNPEKIKSVEGVSRVRIEEATELNQKEFDQLDLRVRGKQDMQITCTFNPVDVDNFLNSKFWVNGTTKEQTCLHTTFLDNRFIGKKYMQVMERLKLDNPEYYKIYALGQRGALQGRIFTQRNILQDIPEQAKLLGYGLDFGFANDPLGLVEIYQYNGRLILNELIYKTGLTNIDLDAEMKQKGVDKNKLIVADSAEPKSIEELTRMGYRIKGATKGKDSINYGINAMKQIGFDVTSSSPNLIKELNKYVRATKKDGEQTTQPVDVDNHLIDATRYFIQTELGYIPPQEGPSVYTVPESLVYEMY